MKKILFITLSLLFALSPALFALNPSRTYKQRPDKFNMEYKEYEVKTIDGEATLKAWFFSASSETSKLILISHNGEGNMADYLRRVQQFTEAGYNVVSYDYRGFGESSEFEIDNNMYIYPHFQDDIQSMIDFCRKNFVQNFDMYGWGIGAGLSMGIGWNRPEILNIIADTPFLSMEDLETRFESWDEPMEVPFAGYEKKYEPIYSLDGPAAKHIKTVYLIIGSNDVLFSLDDMKAFQSKQKTKVNKEIYVVENPDRKDNFRVDPKTYMSKIISVLE